MLFFRRSALPIALFLTIIAYLFFTRLLKSSSTQTLSSAPLSTPTPVPGELPEDDLIHWTKHAERYPVTSFIPLPTSPSPIPRIQHDFPPESRSERAARLQKQNAVKEAALHAWNGYKAHAWTRDELSPETGLFRDPFSGWGATIVDSLDTLIIMGLDDEFELALTALEQIDFASSAQRQINLFETTIRYLGGLLGAHDLTNGKYPILLKKATELGEMLYDAFDTFNRMPQSRWEWEKSVKGLEIRPSAGTIMAELGSLSVEFTRLTQLTDDPKYFDAVQRITDVLERAQNETKLPGMWPTFVDAEDMTFLKPDFTVGGCADSTYEYLPKEHILLGAQTDQYRGMHSTAMETIKEHILFRAMTKDEEERVLFAANARRFSTGTSPSLTYESDHLKCFLGGTVGLGAKVFDRPEDLDIARGLTDGCIWAYDVMPTGIMPETLKLTPCENMDSCSWDEKRWQENVLGRYPSDDYALEQAERRIEAENLPPGVASISSAEYKLRPEAIESVFIMYRITGDKSLQDAAWRMFRNIEKVTRTRFGHSAIQNVRDPQLPMMKDEMESFWLAETLKYFYLIFSEPDLVSLDEYVLNTEAHPFKRPLPR